MTARAYYNEFDPFAAAWLRELIKEGLIADGEVDERTILDVRPADLDGFDQCHFFAGIGGWSRALRLAGIADGAPFWTASLPCQPLSCAGLQQGHADERHLWPAFHALLAERRPSGVFGEQVASADGREWFSGVRADLESLGYACGAADLCAAGVSAPHRRQRLFWVAYAGLKDDRGGGNNRSGESLGPRQGQSFERPAGFRAASGALADADGGIASDRGLQRSGKHGHQPQDGQPFDGMGQPIGARLEGLSGDGADGHQPGRLGARAPGSAAAASASPWRSIAVRCADGNWRRIPADESGQPEPGLFPLAHGFPNRMGVLRGAGNAICPQVAAKFIEAAEGCLA